jgi:hypothetical protein
MKQPLDVAAEERVRADPPARLGLVWFGFARGRWLHSIKNPSPSLIKGLGRGISMISFGWPAMASGQGFMVVDMEMGRWVLSNSKAVVLTGVVISV